MTRIYQPAAGGAGSGLHADLTDVSANQHHAKLHAADHLAAGADAITNIAFLHANTLDHSNALDHASTNDPTVNQKAALAGTGTPSALDKYVSDSDSRMTNSRTPSAHVLDGVLHTVSGLTIGHVLKATGAAAAAFGQLLHSQLGSVGADDHHAQAHTLTSHSTRTHAELTSVGVDDHHNRDHAINGTTHTGTLDDAQIPASIARDSELITAHSALSGLTSGDDHTQYQKESERNVAAGYAPLDSLTRLPLANVSSDSRQTLVGTERSTLVGSQRISLFDPTIPFLGSYAPGSVNLMNDQWVLQYQRYTMNGNQRVTLNGNARLIVTSFTPGSRLVLSGVGGGS